jgi:RNA polymerase sigma factor (TIGR02999 family)
MSVEALSLTELLDRWKSGDGSVENALVERIYPIMRVQAQAQLGRIPGADITMCATELAHEAYERLIVQQCVDWRNRNHFFAIAATVLRRVLVDHLRSRSAEKRGGDIDLFSLDAMSTCRIPGTKDSVDLLVLDQALDQLGDASPELLRIVELRVFSGLGVEEIAEVCSISTATVTRRWRFARAWLSEHLG